MAEGRGQADAAPADAPQDTAGFHTAGSLQADAPWPFGRRQHAHRDGSGAGPRRWPAPPTVAAMLETEAHHGHGLLWVPVALGLGAAAHLAAPRDIAAAAILLPLLATAWLALRLRMAAPGWFPATAFAAAFFAGMAASKVETARMATTLLDGPVVTTVSGRVVARQATEDGHQRYVIRLERTAEPSIRRPPETVRLLARSAHRPITTGGRIVGLARLMPPSGPVLPGGYDFAFDAYFSGVGAVGFFYGAPAPVVGPEPAALGRDWVRRGRLELRRLREAVSTRIRAALPGTTGAVAAALIVADRAGIPEPTVEALRQSGLAHILAISGLHMALAGMTFFVALRLAFAAVPRLAEAVAVKKWAAVGALVVATLYLMLSGAAISTQRAWVMMAIMLVAVMLDRPALTLRNVALAAVAIILLSPSAVTGPSFQMSFAATAALIAAYGAWARRRRAGVFDAVPPAGGPLRLLAGFVVGLAATAIIAGAATGLFAAYHFHRVAGYGLIGNVLAMPLVSLIVMPMALITMVVMPFGLEVVPLRLMGEGIDWVLAVAHWVASLGGDMTTGRIARPAMAAMIAGLNILLLMRSALRFAGAALIAVGLGLALALSPPPPAILISEDGRLAAVTTAAGLASNRSRPSGFVFDQWRRALAVVQHVPPVIGDAYSGAAADGPDPSFAAEAAMRAALRTDIDQATRAGHFVCRKAAWCAMVSSPAPAAGTFDAPESRRLQDTSGTEGVIVITLDNLDHLGAACDLADLVVTPAQIRMRRCRSGAILVTGRSLRRSGALAIDVTPVQRATADAATADAATADNAGAATSRIISGAGPQEQGTGDGRGRPGETLVIRSAVGGVVRPWTVQRYYDWRRDAFDFAGRGIEPVRPAPPAKGRSVSGNGG